MKRQLLYCLGSLAVLAAFSVNASAGVFKTITIDDLYDDWIGVPVLAFDPEDNVDGVDIAEVQVANDNNYLYIRARYYTAKSVQTSIALDNDSDTATGFDIFGTGQVGSEAGWQNDFPFDQRGGFNIGTLIGGAAMLSSFVDSTDREWAIPLDATFDPLVGPGDVFPNSSFNLLLWSDTGATPFTGFEVTDVIPYTLAVPEPSSVLLMLAGCCLYGLRRR